MKNILLQIFLGFIIFFARPCIGQTFLPGFWQGQFILDGVEYPITLKLERIGNRLSGITKLTFNKDSIVARRFYGRLHEDLSMNMYENEVFFEVNQGPNAIHRDTVYRQYQLQYKRDFFDLELNGYWQELHKSPTDPSLKKGIILLKRKAKRPSKDGA